MAQETSVKEEAQNPESDHSDSEGDAEAVDAQEHVNESSAEDSSLDAESDAEQEQLLENGTQANEPDEDSEKQVSTRLPVLARVSSLLFVATKPLTLEQLAEASGSQPEKVEEALGTLSEVYQERVHGFTLEQVAGAWQLRTVPSAATYVQRLVPKTARKLSRAAAETLAVVAYKQPVQRAEIEAIRGVDALPTLKTLLEAKLIRIVGREQTAGHPALYGTTKTFLEKFNLADLSELPSSKELEQFFDEPGEVEEDGEDEDSNEDDVEATQKAAPSSSIDIDDAAGDAQTANH